MSDIDVLRLMLKQIRTEPVVDFTKLRLQFYNLCKGSPDKFADYIAFLAETGAIKINQENATLEKIS